VYHVRTTSAYVVVTVRVPPGAVVVNTDVDSDTNTTVTVSRDVSDWVTVTVWPDSVVVSTKGMAEVKGHEMPDDPMVNVYTSPTLDSPIAGVPNHGFWEGGDDACGCSTRSFKMDAQGSFDSDELWTVIGIGVIAKKGLPLRWNPS
jgi:hypothetical protein